MTIRNGVAEENQVRNLAVDCDDSRIRGRYQYELRANVIADELTQGFRFGSLRLDG
jgi:hypothetical protein